MTSRRHPHSITPARRVGAVLAGMIVCVGLTLAVDALCRAAGIFPPLDQPFFDTGPLALATAYRTVLALLGGWVATRLVPGGGMTQAVAFGTLGVVFNAAGGIVMADRGPIWYPVALTLLSFPAAWMGGRLAVR